jgi:signal transduction histidine kinase
MTSPMSHSGPAVPDKDTPGPGNKAPELYASPALSFLPYAMLVFTDLVAISLERSAPRTLIADLILSAVAALWMLWMYTLHPAWRDRPRLMAVFVTVLIVLGALLVLSDTLYGLWTFTIFYYVLRLRWPWPLYAGAAVAVLAGTSQAYGVNKDTVVGVFVYLIIVAVNVAVADAILWFRRSVAVHDERRMRALDELSESHRRLEATLAENAGLQQQLLTQAREAGVLDERQRMAREIHDTLAQGLTGIITQLQAAEQAADDPAGWRRHFEAATRLARDSLSEARRSVEALRPESLETGRLSEALAEVAGRWSALHGIPAQVTTTGTARPMPPEAEFALLRTAQEALANVAKHARATRVGVTLSYMEHEVALDVRDDGRGFDLAELCTEAAKAAKAAKAAQAAQKTSGRASVAHANGVTGLVGLSVSDELRHPAGLEKANGGFGLVSMRQRIESLAGTLQVESEPGFGTGISACLPLASEQLQFGEARS